MNELFEYFKPVWGILMGEQGWMAAALTWSATLRFVFKWFNEKLQAGLTKVLSKVAASPETDDDALILRLLDSAGYRWFARLVDLISSIKLPSHADFTALVEQMKAPKPEQKTP